jgi:hypothetical protein
MISGNTEFLFLPPHSLGFLESYYGYFGNDAEKARSHKFFYHPRCLPLAVPDTGFSHSLRQLAADVGSSLTAIFRRHFAEKKARTEAEQLALAVSPRNRFDTPTFVRLDVVHSNEGLKVVEVNSGNCGGACIYGITEDFLIKQAGASIDHNTSLTWKLDSLYCDNDSLSKVKSLYIGKSGYLFSIARLKRIKARRPDIYCEAIQLSDYIPNDRDRSGCGFYLEFLLGGILKNHRSAVLREFFCNGPHLRSVSPIADRFLSDKVYVANASDELPDVLARKWNRWVAPTAELSASTVARGQLDLRLSQFGSQSVVMKPANGFCGRDVVVLPSVSAIPRSPAFYGNRTYVAQPFYETVTAQVPAVPDAKLHVVYGVFLVRYRGAFQYAGATVRYSSDRIVNLERLGELGILVEPEWGVDMGMLRSHAEDAHISFRTGVIKQATLSGLFAGRVDACSQ